METIKIKRLMNWRAWLRGMGTSIIQGGSSAVLGSMGLLGANLVGVPVTPIDLKQTAGVFFGAALIRLFFFLNSNPLPEEEEVTEAADNPPVA